MATDLDTRRPPSTAKISPSRVSDHRNHRHRVADAFEFSDQTSANEGDQSSRTPRSPRYMIPAAVSCPPAPKKRRRADPVCKRKLFDLHFFEAAGRDEVESLFSANPCGSAKRKFAA